MIALSFVFLITASLAWIIDEWGELEARLVEEHKNIMIQDWRAEVRWSEIDSVW